jgi:DNA-binding MarR family transcriptional regulator
VIKLRADNKSRTAPQRGEKIAEKQLIELLQSYKEVDRIFHAYAKAHNIPDSSFFILYVLAKHGSIYSQHELCEEWSFSAQTINSALKNLERQGIVTLELLPGNRKSKEIHLTEKGRAVTDGVIRDLLDTEIDSFLKIEQKDREVLISAFKCFVANFRNGMKEKIKCAYGNQQDR